MQTAEAYAPHMARTQHAPPNSRTEYRWRVDAEAGFEQASYIYDANGRLAAVDYKPRRTSRVEKPVLPKH